MGSDYKYIWSEVDDDFYAAMKDSCSATNNDSPYAVREYTVEDLWEQAWCKAGRMLFYMQFLHPTFLIHRFKADQKVRVEMMCYGLAEEYKYHLDDTAENREWFHHWMATFEDEVENMC